MPASPSESLHRLHSALCRRMLTNRTERRSVQSAATTAQRGSCQQTGRPQGWLQEHCASQATAVHLPHTWPAAPGNRGLGGQASMYRRADQPSLSSSFLSLSALQQSEQLRTSQHRFQHQRGPLRSWALLPCKQDKPVLTLLRKAGHSPLQRDLQEQQPAPGFCTLALATFLFPLFVQYPCSTHKP